MVGMAKTLRNKMMLRLGVATGMRVGSMSRLKKEEVDIETGKITLLKCKGGVTRNVYIKEDLK